MTIGSRLADHLPPCFYTNYKNHLPLATTTNKPCCYTNNNDHLPPCCYTNYKNHLPLATTTNKPCCYTNNKGHLFDIFGVCVLRLHCLFLAKCLNFEIFKRKCFNEILKNKTIFSIHYHYL